MAESEELKKIKKVYGENFMKLCRELFPTLLETEGRLYEILSLTFSNNSRTLYEDIMNNNLQGEFKNYIYSKIDVEDKDKRIIANKTPYELLDEAGYTLYECKTEEEIQSFKKYYAPGEELCTFWGGRLNSCEVFFAVRKDVEDIKREDFYNPKREDTYGTSVMGIQFNKTGMCTVSIKNRYNHTVNNPDATYGNDLDRISPGLNQSFGKLLQQRGLKLNYSNVEKIKIPGYTVAGDGKYYKYNMEINGTYYCPGNIVLKHGEVHKLENQEKKLLLDYFVLDMEKKTIELYDNEIYDSFIDDLQNLKKVEIRKNKEKGKNTRTIIIQKEGRKEPITIEIDKGNQIIGYRNKELTEVGHDFLAYNEHLSELDLSQLRIAGNNFLMSNQALRELELLQLTNVGESFLDYNAELNLLNLPQLIEAGTHFLACNRELKELKLPKLKKIGTNCLDHNQVLEKVKLEQLTNIGTYFLDRLDEHERLIEFETPKLPELQDKFADVIKKNLQKEINYNERKVTNQEIAKLAKDREITTSEINNANKAFNNLNKDKEINKE